MHPFLFEVFGFKVYSYGMAMIVAFITCFILTLKHRDGQLLTDQDIYNLCLLAIVSLLFGSRLVDLIVEGNFTMAAFLKLLKFWERSHFSFWPAFLIAVFLLFSYCRMRKIPVLPVMDRLLPVAILGIFIQRTFGCFMAGCCYGKPTHLMCGVVFPPYTKTGTSFPGIPLHPTQLYYGISSLMISLFLWWHGKRRKAVGSVTAIGFVLLAVSYFFITFLRGDIPQEQLFCHLSISQYMSLILLILGGSIYKYCVIPPIAASKV